MPRWTPSKFPIVAEIVKGWRDKENKPCDKPYSEVRLEIQGYINAAHAPKLPAARTFEGVTVYHWLVVIIASCGWLFDCMDQRIFILARESALKELLRNDAQALAGGSTGNAGNRADDLLLVANYNQAAPNSPVLSEDESYTLDVSASGAVVRAPAPDEIEAEKADLLALPAHGVAVEVAEVGGRGALTRSGASGQGWRRADVCRQRRGGAGVGVVDPVLPDDALFDFRALRQTRILRFSLCLLSMFVETLSHRRPRP